MANVLLIVQLILALALIGVVLMQRSEGGGLGIGGGGGGGGGLMSGRGAATALSKVTWALATAFLVVCLILTILGAQESGDASVIDRLGTELPAREVDPSLPPALQGDLLPPGVDGGVVLPPADGGAALPPAAD